MKRFLFFGILTCAGEHTCIDYVGGRLMFRIKICGVREDQDIEDVAAAGADAVGLNFHPPSIRYLDRRSAMGLSERAAAAGLTRVGVFVDAAVPQIIATADAVGLDLVQLHGDQTLADVEQLTHRGYRAIRVIRLPSGKIDAETVGREIQPWLAVGCPLLLDAAVGTAVGGMGTRLDWDAVGHWSQQHGQSLCWALAGGLDCEVVADAIAKSGANRIDVASGVESPRGKKSQPKIAALVKAALQAWQRRPPA